MNPTHASDTIVKDWNPIVAEACLQAALRSSGQDLFMDNTRIETR
jgi:hypothetical protein